MASSLSKEVRSCPSNSSCGLASSWTGRAANQMQPGCPLGGNLQARAQARDLSPDARGTHPSRSYRPKRCNSDLVGRYRRNGVGYEERPMANPWASPRIWPHRWEPAHGPNGTVFKLASRRAGARVRHRCPATKSATQHLDRAVEKGDESQWDHPPRGTVALADLVTGGDGVGMKRRRSRVQIKTEASPFAGFRFPPTVIVLAVRWYLRFGLSYRTRSRGHELPQPAASRWSIRGRPFAELQAAHGLLVG